MRLYGSLKELVSAVFRKDTFEITLRPNQSVTYNGARDIQLPAKNGDAVLVSSGDIVNADIAAGAAIVDTKLATISTAGKVSGGAITSGTIAGSTSLNTSGTVTASSLSGPLTGNVTGNVSGTAGNITATSNSTLTTLSSLSLPGSQVSGNISGNAANVTGTVAIANGGTGQTTQQAALTALSGTQASGQYLRSNGTNTLLSTIQAGDVPTLNQNTTGTAANVTGIVATANGGTGVNSTATFPSTGTVATTSNKLSAFAATSSSELAGVISDETGSGSLVFGTSPTLSAPQVNSSLVVQQIATPSNPSSGFNKLYTKSDGILYKLDSAGNEVAVGSGAGGSGEINTVTNPSAATDTTGWTAGTSHSVAKDSSNSPLNPVVPTSFGITSSAAITLGSQTSTSGVYDGITMPSGLQNRKLKVEFFFTTPVSSSGTWAVAVYQGSTKVALSTDSSGDTILPSNVIGGKFVAYFDTTSSASYSLNFVQRTRSLSNALYITNVVVGPGIQPQGAVVGEWQPYTPTISNLGSGSTSIAVGYYRQVGSTLEAKFTFTKDATAGTGATTVTVSLPANLSIDFTKISTDEQSYAGSYDFRNGSSPNTNNPGSVKITSGSTTTFYFQKSGAAVAALTGADFPGTARIEGAISLPIAQWAGSGTVQLAQNDVEYAFNSSTSTSAGDTTSFGYGPSGAQIQSITASLNRRVRFQSPIQPGDQLVVEVSTDRLKWQPVQSITQINSQEIQPFSFQNTALGGVGVYAIINSTDVDVRFGQYAALNGSTFGATGSVWSAGGAGAAYWRVRKSSAGAAVGFGIVSPGVSSGLVSAAGLPGNTTGNAIASGYMGEVVTYQTVTATLASSTGTRGLASFSIPSAGIWKIEVTAWINASGDPGGSALTLSTTSATSAVFSQLLNGATASEYTDKSCYLIGGIASRVGQNISCVAGFSGATPVYINFYSNNAISATSGNVKITALATRIA